MMAASVLLVTHSSSLVTPSGRAPRQRCRGSIFLFTNGMLPARPHASPGQRKKKEKKKIHPFCLFFLPTPSALCPGDLSFSHWHTEDAAPTTAAGLFHTGDTPWVQTSGCRQVQRCQDGGEDCAGALPLCSADKPGKPFPLTFPELHSNQQQTLTCCSPSAGPEKPQPTQTEARSEQALVMLLFPAQCKALQGLICAHAAPRQAAAASSPLLSAASPHGPHSA